MTVHKKLMAARIALQGKRLNKSGLNKFAGYQYFELGDFLPFTQLIFYELGLCGVVSFTADIATLTITDTEDGTAVVLTSPMGSAALKGCHEVQNIGAVETYQRRYLWVSAMEIVEHDALDASVGSGAVKGAAIVHTPTGNAAAEVDAEWLTYLRDLAMELISIVKEEGNAVGRLNRENLDNEQNTALWTLLDSKTRSYIKAQGAQLKAAAGFTRA